MRGILGGLNTAILQDEIWQKQQYHDRRIHKILQYQLACTTGSFLVTQEKKVAKQVALNSENSFNSFLTGCLTFRL